MITQILNKTQFSFEKKELYDTTLKFFTKEFSSQQIKNNTDLQPLISFDEKLFEKFQNLGYFQLMTSEKNNGFELGISELNSIFYASSPIDASYNMILLTHLMAYDTLSFCSKNIPDLDLSVFENKILSVHIYNHEDVVNSQEELSIVNNKIYGKVKSLSLASLADGFILAIKNNSNEEKNTSQLYYFSREAKNLIVEKPIFTLGFRNAPVGDLLFDGVDVSQGILLSKNSSKIKDILTRQRNKFIPALLAIMGGIAWGAYLEAESYMKERYQTGSLLIDKPVLKTMLIDIKILALEAIQKAETLANVSNNFSEKDFLNNSLFLPSFIKFRHEIADAMSNAIQLLGGYGYIREFGQEKRYRDARQLCSVFGQSDLLKLEI